jgi:hypothetical protein
MASLNRTKSRRHLTWRRAVGLIAAGALMASFVLWPIHATPAIAAPDAAGNPRSIDLSKLPDDCKFEGSNTCQSCHGKDSTTTSPASRSEANDRSYSVWKTVDRHSKSYSALSKSNELGKQICTALNIPSAAKSEQCLGCHSVDVTDASRKATSFRATEGNSCNSCHGPSSNWHEPHQTVGWMDQQRKAAASHDALLKTWGIYDTKPFGARANLCTSCHLQIDASLVKAGHPQPNFELNYYQSIEPRHWFDDEGGKFGAAKAWAHGQTVCLREAMAQLGARASAASPDAAAIADAWNQAAAHLLVYACAAGPMGQDEAALRSHYQALKTLAAKPVDNAKDIAAQAKLVADMATAAEPAVDKFEPDQKAVVAILQKVAAEPDLASLHSSRTDAAGPSDQFGMNQQAFAIYSMYAAFSTGTGQNGDALLAEVRDKLTGIGTKDKPAISDSDYAKALSEVKAKLPAN